MTTIILLIVASLSFIIYTNSKNRKKLSESGFNLKNTRKGGSYIGGHPEIDNSIKNVQLISSSDQIAICNVGFKPQGYINKISIKNVVFEDATSFDKRVSGTRLLLVGVFAFAWKKKRKNENAYVIIEWNDGRFDHSTSFLFEGIGSTTQANKTRNWLLKNIRQESLAA